MPTLLSSTKPLSGPMLQYCQLDPAKHVPVKCYLKLKGFNLRKWTWKCMSSVKWWPGCLGLNVFIRNQFVTPNFIQRGHGLCCDNVIKWKHFPRYWPFVLGIHRSPVNSPHKGQWHGALMFSLICAWINGWVNTREAGDLRRHRAHDVVTVIRLTQIERHILKAVKVKFL